MLLRRHKEKAEAPKVVEPKVEPTAEAPKDATAPVKKSRKK